ncbi:MAG TPA: hypothetical protein VKB95_08675 [Chitinophagaceae bacterium]|nr:hypothetical protein [Chitinophagaceae bacterium]
MHLSPDSDRDHFVTGNFEQILKYDFINKEFNDYRSRMNEVILSKNNLVMKRLWNLDTNSYENGVLDTKTKEMPGLVVRQPADASLR